MSDEAKVTMLLYSGLLPDEQRKLESLDNAIATTLIESGETSRAIWAAATVGGQRVVSLRQGEKTLLEITALELAGMSGETVLSRLNHSLSSPG
jgi:hypothetical protein